MKKRILVGLLAGTAIFGTVTGLAASLDLSSKKLGSDSAVVSACDTDGIETNYTYNSLGTITHVVVSGLQDGSLVVGSGACDGQTVHVELLDTASELLAGATGSGTLVGDADISDDSITIEIGTDPLASLIGNVRVTTIG